MKDGAATGQLDDATLDTSQSRRDGPGRAVIQVLSISELERASGVPRSTIHYYIRERLLPEPQKTAGTRSLYTEDHLALLGQISRAKAEGRSLAQIRSELRLRLQQLKESHVDLEAQEYDRTHLEILRFSTKELMLKGYRHTYIADIIRELAISSSVFYQHFPSKRHLLVECFRRFVDVSIANVEPRAAVSENLAERVLMRILARFAVYPLSRDLHALSSTEMLQGDDNLHATVVETWDKVIQVVENELATMVKPGPSKPAVSTELLAFCLDEALQGLVTRALWDHSVSRAELLRTHLWLWLAVCAALRGDADVDGELARHEDLILQFADAPNPVFTGLTDA
jgi:DNA-binding transcriptional MerR regulator